MECDLASSVHDWILEHPEVQPLLDQLQIDTSCGGRSLEYACRRRGHDPQVVLDRLTDLIRGDRGNIPEGER